MTALADLSLMMEVLNYMNDFFLKPYKIHKYKTVQKYPCHISVDNWYSTQNMLFTKMYLLFPFTGNATIVEALLLLIVWH